MKNYIAFFFCCLFSSVLSFSQDSDDGNIKMLSSLHASTSSGFKTESSDQNLAGYWKDQKLLSGDFNGDGIDDLVNIYGEKDKDEKVKTQVWVHLSDGSSFEYQSALKGLAGFWSQQKWLVGDFNGDGKDDLVNLYGKRQADGKIKTQAWLHLSTGSTFEYNSNLKTLAGFWDEQKWLAGDFNGDGKDDLVNLYGSKKDGQVKTQAWLHLSTGPNFEYQSNLQTLAGFWDEQKWIAGDFNGDGKEDLVNLYEDQLRDEQVNTRSWLHLSVGSSFEYNSNLKTLESLWDGQEWLSGDFDGDGKEDLVSLYDEKPTVIEETEEVVEETEENENIYVQQTICRSSDVPEGKVIVGYTRSVNCGTRFGWSDTKNAIIIRRPASRDNICRSSEVPEGYVIIGYSTKGTCLSLSSWSERKNSLAIKKPENNIEYVCRNSPVPSGYEVAGYTTKTTCLSTFGFTDRKNAKIIKKTN